MGKIKLSICIAVYNQVGIVKWNLDNILSYQGDDIEVIISDDCSTENIFELVQSYHDNRLKYYCNEYNLGHDKNILKGFQRCTCSNVFLLRTADTLLADKIPDIISFCKSYMGGYCRFSCLDENGYHRIVYQDVFCTPGEDAVSLNSRLLIHPSGELYNLNYITEDDFKTWERYIDKYFTDKRGFVVHTLIRDKLAMNSGLLTSSIVAWVYSYTSKRKDIAKNSSINGTSIYAPEKQYERMNCEMEYIIKELEGNGKEKLLHEVILKFYRLICHDFKYINKSKRMQTHYAYKAIRFNAVKERRCFVNNLKVFIANYEDYSALFDEIMKHDITITRLTGWKIKRYIEKLISLPKSLCHYLKVHFA